jgi:uncharacterized membrane protein HdeD (DUF308 family)
MKVTAYVFLLLGIVAFGLGVWMFADPSMLNQLDPTIRLVFSILLLLYGGFRIITATGELRKKKQTAA